MALLVAALFAVVGCSNDGPAAVADLHPIDSSSRPKTRKTPGQVTERLTGRVQRQAPSERDPGRPNTDDGGKGTTEEDEFGVGNNHPDDPADLATVKALLARYDQTVTALAMFPWVGADPASQIRSEWASLVPLESALHQSVLNRLVTVPLDEGTLLLPGPDGVGFRHHPEHTARRDDGSIEFSWCGYSPGIRVTAAGRSIADDSVGHFRGVGRVDRDSAGRWIIDALDDLETNVLPAGSTDPCTTVREADE